MTAGKEVCLLHQNIAGNVSDEQQQKNLLAWRQAMETQA